MSAQESLTELLQDWRGGDEGALDKLTPVVYAQLKRIAVNAFRGERSGHTLQPTALVNEAYIKLINAEVDWQDRAHFFAMASRMMRRILVNHANARLAAKRGGSDVSITYIEGAVSDSTEQEQLSLLVLSDLIDKLSEQDERCAQAIELQYFGGLTHKEMSEALGISTTTLERDLKFAKAWLYRNMSAR